jgi:hypothetical protein
VKANLVELLPVLSFFLNVGTKVLSTLPMVRNGAILSVDSGKIFYVRVLLFLSGYP